MTTRYETSADWPAAKQRRKKQQAPATTGRPLCLVAAEPPPGGDSEKRCAFQTRRQVAADAAGDAFRFGGVALYVGVVRRVAHADRFRLQCTDPLIRQDNEVFGVG
jgi:hypothetical protein